MTARPTVTWFLLGVSILAAALLLAETPPANPNGVLQLTATTANVAGAPDPVRIEILRWSTDDERERLMSAWNLKPSAAGPSEGRGAKQGKAAGKGRGPAGPVENNASPEAVLARTLNETTTVGYVWSSEMAGYALRYAGKVDNPDGSQRIILITQRRLGAVNQRWNPTFEGAANSYEFSVIEVHLNAKGEGEGRISLVGKVVPDVAAKIVTLENYEALPVVLRDVRLRPSEKPAKK
ncbi:MAG TPA: hypothetical protein VGQ49_24850 [Bryobacteraceae bacterium]|jgi:hypothetical protein|nr:hypothetical protein [Bryobacteraceae bacterium]